MNNIVPTRITGVDRFQQDFGNLEQYRKDEIIRILRGFMLEIRVILADSARMMGIILPEISDRCATCAFNPATDGFGGFAATAYGLLLAILTDQQVFLCHGDEPDWKAQHPIDPENPLLCHGFQSVVTFSGAKTIALALKTKAAIEVFVS